ncbi:hypothetical protein C8A00DRAFT_32396 [Chaetomidium leptoderma]|uniref:Uncharacterized protein n=1 Tax=Chaetomidium leptoderma TaxID=669021 RepID=A0AAN6VR17_9PEZI|nr:hypothetical protein C8A00DRAFT_32396 [Chaetomidium leptoderma]
MPDTNARPHGRGRAGSEPQTKTERAKRADKRWQFRLEEQLSLAEEGRREIKEQLAERKKELAECENQLAEREKQLAESGMQVTTLKEAVSQQPELLTRDVFTDARRKMSRYAAREVEHRHTYGASLRVYQCWATIRREVEYVATFYFPERVSWDSIKPATQEKLICLAPKAKLYLESNKLQARHLFRAWMWQVLDQHLFSKEAGPWLGEHWEAYSQLRRVTSPLATPADTEWAIRYHIWRNLTVGLICQVTGDKSRASVESVVQILKDELSPLLRVPEELSQSKLDEKLGRIAECALEADLCMHLDRTDWAVIRRHPDTSTEYGFPFEAAERADGFKMEACFVAHPFEPEANRPAD